MNYQAALTALDTAIENGQWMKVEIEVDGHRVRYQTLSEWFKFRNWLVSKINSEDAASPYNKGRIPIGNQGDGLV